MATYIEREAYRDRLADLESWCQDLRKPGLKQALEMLDEAPVADVAPVVHGRWISFLDGDHIMPERYYRCSRCGRVESKRQPYCHCGAKMDGGNS